jgi:hypothetical protein
MISKLIECLVGGESICRKIIFIVKNGSENDKFGINTSHVVSFAGVALSTLGLIGILESPFTRKNIKSEIPSTSPGQMTVSC